MVRPVDRKRDERRNTPSRWRRRAALVAIAAVVTVGLAGCGGDDSATAPGGSTSSTAAGGTASSAAAGETRTVETENGPVDVPVDPQRVVALDEYAALNALALGIEPVLVFGAFQSVVGKDVLTDAGIEVLPAASEAGPNVERIAAADPDLILFSTEGALTSNFDQLIEIAPAVSMPYTQPWRDVIGFTAEVFDRDAEADALVTLLEERIDALHDELGADPQSMAILGDTFGMVFSAAMISPLSQIVDEAGFTRPQVEATGTADPVFDSAVMTTTERLGEHDADAVVVLSGAYYDADSLLAAPTFQALPAVRDGRSYVVDGDMWFGTYPFAIWWLLDDLTAIADGTGQAGIGEVDDTAARWAAFEAAQR